MSAADRRRARRPTTAPARPEPPGPRAPFLSLHAPAGLAPGSGRLLAGLTWAVIALLGAALLAMVLGPHRVGDYMTETDFYGQYAAGARAIQQGRLDPSHYGVVGPVYEIALALVAFVVRDLFLAAGLLAVAAAVGALALWAALLRRRGDARLALLGTLFLATNATFFRYGYSVTTDALALLLQSAALFALLARPGPRAALGAGLLAGLAFLTRYNAGVLLPAGLVALLAGGTLQARRGRAALLFAAGFLLPVVPWVVFSYARGTGVSFQLHHNVAYEVFARARGIPWDTYQSTMQSQFRGLADVVARDPGAVAGRMLFNVFDHLRLDAGRLLGWPVALCALLGLLLGLDRPWRRLWPLAVAWAFLFLALVPAFHSERYSLALLPLYATAAALAFASPRFALVTLRGPRLWLKGLLALVPLALALAASMRVQARVLDQLPVETLEAARTLRTQARPGERIIARKAHVAFHAGLEPVPFPFATDLAELAAYARERGARWLYFSWPEAQTRPEFWHLLDTTGVVPGLVPRLVTAPHPAVLYEIGPGFGAAPAWAADDTLRALHDARARALVDPTGLVPYGRLALAAGRLAEARWAYEQALPRQPRSAPLRVALGMVCVRLGDLPAALAAFREAEALDPAGADARIGQGWALLLSGRERAAAAAWRPVIAAARDSDTLGRMIALYRALGDPAAEAEARAALARRQGAP
jgi:4-amino-4-deoxy-L-arabinose transferase-like glycosyltransferase